MMKHSLQVVFLLLSNIVHVPSLKKTWDDVNNNIVKPFDALYINFQITAIISKTTLTSLTYHLRLSAVRCASTSESYPIYIHTHLANNLPQKLLAGLV